MHFPSSSSWAGVGTWHLALKTRKFLGQLLSSSHESYPSGKVRLPVPCTGCTVYSKQRCCLVLSLGTWNSGSVEIGTGIFAGGVVAVKSCTAPLGRWGHGQRTQPPCLEEGNQGWKSSKLCARGKNHRLRVPSVSLPPDASAVDMDLYEAQTLADALKWYLQELPTPLIPPALYSDLVHMAQGKHTCAPPTPENLCGAGETLGSP